MISTRISLFLCEFSIEKMRKNIIRIIALLFLFACEEKEKDASNPQAYVSQVFDYQYAPGQHAHLAKKPDWLKGENSSSTIYLGGWGGYVVLGFDHDVYNTEGKDIVVICGMSASPEPGIIYLMDDTNGNGLPDDEWFEIRGSETDSPDCIRDYALTYYKPETAEGSVTWKDKSGNAGELPNSSNWWWSSDSDSVRFEGTRLPDAYFNCPTEKTPENWQVYPDLFRYGYAENGTASNRNPAEDYSTELRGNRIDISDAIDKNGNAANLAKIRFVKIQTGVFQQAGWLGEVSTEITGVGDLSLIAKE